MWKLEDNTASPGTVHYLPCGISLIVGRKNCHILLTNDASISRQHASITITHPTANVKDPNKIPEVKLVDLGSKYGTFVNEGIASDQILTRETEMHDGDTVRFGRMENTWKLKYERCIVTTSTIDAADKAILQSNLMKLGGHLTNHWSETCSYLVMNNISLTVKVVCALASGRYIVTPDFFKKWLDAVTDKGTLPNASSYLPPLMEISLRNGIFSPCEERRHIFKQKVFIFSSEKQLRRMKQPVHLSGGKAVPLTEENGKSVLNEGIILLALPVEREQDQQKMQIFLKAKDMLTKNNLRVIPESDIGLAILHKSTESHCNPAFKVSSILKRTESSMSQYEGAHVYATETQETENSSINISGTRVVPETLTGSRRTSGTISTFRGVSGTSGISGQSSGISTCDSTYASMTPAQGAKLNCKNNSGDNDIKTEKKRMRSSDDDFRIPHPKRSAKPPVEIIVDPTQPIEMQDDEEDDDGIDNPSCEVKFNPDHVSTQKRKPCIKDTNSKECNPISSSTNVPQTIEIPRTFEPYTLQSLEEISHDDDIIDNENDISTEPYVPIKTEPPSLPIDEPDCAVHFDKRKENDVNVPNVQDGWVNSKKTKVDNLNNLRIKTERKSSSDHPLPRSFKQEPPPSIEEDLFNIPATSQRGRRRAEAKRKAEENEVRNNALDEEEDAFNIPSSSRAERHKRIKMERMESNNNVCKTENVQDVIDDQHNKENELPPTQSRIPPTSESWISKKNEDSAPVQVKAPVKVEVRKDLDELSGAFEKSLVVVEFVPLIRRKIVTTTQTNETSNNSLEGLKNFKKFRKSIGDSISLPKIIGGKDLISHDAAINLRRDTWFKDNAEVSQIFEEREEAEHVQDNQLDEFFNLERHNPRSRGRTRR